jgi:predicted dehydrogenase
MHDAVHLVDRMAWLLDRPIVEVHGRTSSFVRGIEGVEDAGVATLMFAGGAIGSLFVHEASYPLHKDDPRVPMPGRLELEVHGTAGSLRYRTWQSLEFDSAGEHWEIGDAPRDELRLEVGEFLAAIRDGRAPSVGATEGRRSVAVVRAIYDSARLGRPVQLDEG